MTMARVLVTALTTLLLGCSSSSGGVDGGGLEGGGDSFTAEERGAYDRGSDSHLTAQHLLGLADSLFSFDPTLDPSKTAEQNAAAIQAQATSQLAGCGKVTLNGTTVVVDFGAPPGCTLASGTKASGSISLAVTAAGASLTVTATFTTLVVNGKDLSGTATFATTNGTAFTVTLSLTSAGTTHASNLTVAGAGGSMTVDGTVSAKTGDVTLTLTFTKVVWVAGQCYPSSGTLRVSSGVLTETITFGAATPTTGQVQVTILKKTVTAQLPAYGSCPPKKGAG
jgi:hypothetical protein